VGYVPVLNPLLRPLDNPVVALLIPVVPIPVELPTLLEPAAPVASAPPAPPAPCARAIEEVTARTEAKAIVVSFMWFFPCRGKTAPRDGDIESDGPACGAG
jgi:hypothetical protein